MAYKMKGHTLPGINQKSEGKNLSDGRAKSSALQKADKPTEAELIAQADARFGGGVKVPQYNKDQTLDGKQIYSNSRNFNSPIWNELSEKRKKTYLEKGVKATARRKGAYKTESGGMKQSPVKKEFPKGTVDVSKRNVSTSKKRRSKPKVFLDKSIEQIQTEWKEKKKNEQSKKENNSTNTNTNTKPKKKAEKRNMKVVNPTLVKGVDY